MGSMLDEDRKQVNERKGRLVKGSRDIAVVAGRGRRGKGEFFKGVCVDSTVSLCADGKGLGDRRAERRGYLEERGSERVQAHGRAYL